MMFSVNSDCCEFSKRIQSIKNKIRIILNQADGEQKLEGELRDIKKRIDDLEEACEVLIQEDLNDDLILVQALYTSQFVYFLNLSPSLAEEYQQAIKEGNGNQAFQVIKRVLDTCKEEYSELEETFKELIEKANIFKPFSLKHIELYLYSSSMRCLPELRNVFLQEKEASEIGVLNARGDGNCGLRASIQSICFSALLKQKPMFAIEFMRELISEEFSRSMDAIKAIPKKEQGKETWDLIKNLTSDELKAILENFLLEYEEAADSQEKTENFVKKCFDLINSSKEDIPIYFLATCLRFALVRHQEAHYPDTIMGDEKNSTALRTLHEPSSLHLEYVLDYYKRKKIAYYTYKFQETLPEKLKIFKQVNNLGSDNPSHYSIDVHLFNQGEGHFVSLIPSEDLILLRDHLNCNSQNTGEDSVYSRSFFRSSPT